MKLITEEQLVSVIIPCLNVENFIGECIESVINQSYRPLEVLLIDNKSTDNTLSILQHYSEKYSFIHCFQENQKGACAARNKGLFKSTGDWIQFLDADDILLPNKIQHQKMMISNQKEELGVLVGTCRYQTLSGTEKELIPDRNTWLGLLKGNLGNTCANLWNKEELLRVGGWNVNLPSSQEYDLLFRVLKNNENIIFDNGINTVIRERMGSISTTNLGQNEEIAAKLRIEIYQYLIAQDKILMELKNDYLQVLIQHLAKLGKYDSRLASKIFQLHYPTDFKIYNSSIGRFYTYCFNILGFQITQFIYKYYTFLRSSF